MTAAIWVIGMAEVFVPSTAPALQILSSARNTSCLASTRSKMASTTMSASAAASRSVVVVIRPSVASTSSSVILPLAANRPSESRIAGEAAVQRGVVDVPHGDLPAGLRRHLGDARAHQTRADDREPTRHVRLPSS